MRPMSVPNFALGLSVTKAKSEGQIAHYLPRGCMTENSKILTFIAQCDDAEKLRTLVKRARERGEADVADAAFRKLIALVPSERPGTAEHDFWQTVHAFEYLLTEERGKTTRLARTRQKIGRVGVIQTLIDWALSDKETDGFKMLLERNMPELTGEAIVLCHSDRFAPNVVSAARNRLMVAQVNIDRLPSMQA
jgi:hypothetical protein